MYISKALSLNYHSSVFSIYDYLIQITYCLSQDNEYIPFFFDNFQTLEQMLIQNSKKLEIRILTQIVQIFVRIIEHAILDLTIVTKYLPKIKLLLKIPKKLIDPNFKTYPEKFKFLKKHLFTLVKNSLNLLYEIYNRTGTFQEKEGCFELENLIKKLTVNITKGVSGVIQLKKLEEFKNHPEIQRIQGIKDLKRYIRHSTRILQGIKNDEENLNSSKELIRSIIV
jgi:hypothetical protein